MEENATTIEEELLGSLPSADFVINCSQEESDEDICYEGDISIFNRSQHLHSLNVGHNSPNISLSGSECSLEASEWLSSSANSEDNVPVQPTEITTSSYGIRPTTRQLVAVDNSEVDLGKMRVEANVDNDCDDAVEEWSKFQSHFESLMTTSEQQLEREQQQQLATQPKLSQLRDELMMSLIASMNSCVTSTHNDADSTSRNPVCNDTESVTSTQLTPPATTSTGSVKCVLGGHRTSSHPTLIGNQAVHRHSVLQSGKFEHLSESELDRALEAIKEEGSREGSITPTLGSVVETSVQGSSWESLTNPKTANDILMQQLQQLNVEHTSLSAEDSQQGTHSLLSAPHQHMPGVGVSGDGEDNDAAGKSDRGTVYLDLRPPEETISVTKDSAAHRLLAMRMPMSKSSSDDSEDSMDPYQWQQERRQIKSSLSASPDKCTSSPECSSALASVSSHPSQLTSLPVDLPVLGDLELSEEIAETHVRPSTDTALQATQTIPRPTPRKHAMRKKQNQQVAAATSCSSLSVERKGEGGADAVSGGKKSGGSKGGGSRRHRTSSSGSFSEDDVFVITEPCWNEGSSKKASSFQQHDLSSPSEEFSPGSPSTLSDKPGTLSDKQQSNKKSKSKKKKKKRKDSSDSDRGGGGENSSDSSPPVSRGKKGKGGSGRRSRTDSLTQSSDDDVCHKLESSSTASVGCEEEEEETPEKRRAREEQMRAELQRKIESRKPPSVKNVPNTEPIFHQDVSFTPVIPSCRPLLPPKALILLSLPNNLGLTYRNNRDPSLLSGLELPVQQELFSLLLVWLIRQATDAETRGIIKQSDREKEEVENVELWKPFTVSGLQQTTTTNTSPHVVVGIARVSDQEGGDTLTALTHLLDSEPLSRVLDPLLPLVSDQTHHKPLQSVGHLPLSSVLTADEDPTPLTTPLSFYWLCLQKDDTPLPLHCLKSTALILNTVCTVQPPYSTNTELLYSMLKDVYRQGLDLAGIRVVYPTVSQMQGLKRKSDVGKNTCVNGSNTSVECARFAPTLALAVRGPHAVTRMADVIGSEDLSLARSIEPNSLNARFSVVDGTAAISSVHSQYWSGLELARWFGGRACVKTGSVLGVSDPTTKQERRKRQRVRFSESEDGEVITPTLTPSDINLSFPPLISNRPALVSFPYAKLVVVASPLLPPSCYAALLQSLADQGLHIHGTKRLRLNSKRALALSILPPCIPYFTPSSSNPPSPSVAFFGGPPTLLSINEQSSNSTYPPLPSLLIAVGQENASAHKQAVTRQVLADLKEFIHSTKHNNTHSLVSTHLSDIPGSLLHIASYTDDVLKAVGSFTFTPSTTNGYKLAPSLLNSNGSQEELAVVGITAMCKNHLDRAVTILNCLMGVDTMSNQSPSYMLDNEFGKIMAKENREKEEDGRFELLGLKIVPELSRYQAKQLCPIPTSNTLYQDAMEKITGQPALLVVVRGLNSNQQVQKRVEGSTEGRILSQLSPGLKSCEVIVSQSLEQAFHLTSVFFIDKELFAHPDCWFLCGYTPQGWLGDCAVLSRLQNDPEPLVSVCVVDAERPRLLVRVLDKLARNGFTVVGMSLLYSQQLQLEQEWVLDKATKMLAVCVQRLNAVWQLHHELRPFIASSDVYRKSLYYSPSFAAAVSDVQQFFPNGVHTHHPALVKYYQVAMAPSDHFNPFPIDQDYFDLLSINQSNMSPLTEDTCLVLPSIHVSSFSSPTSSSSISYAPFVMVLDVIVRAEFSITNLQLVRLSSNMVEEVCSCVDTQLKTAEFSKGPSLVMSLRRTNAASCFMSILTSSLQQHGIRAREDNAVTSELLKAAVVPSNAKQAQVLLKLFQWK